jgi:RNA polymerase sigma factor (sigma-70 family)
MSSAECAEVIVIDDDIRIQNALKRLLPAHGFKVRGFSSAKEFLENIDRVLPGGCLLLDIEMPGMNGIELQALLLQRGLDIPVVFMTGRATVPRSVQAMKQGAVDFLEKPVDGQTLINVIRNAVERSRRQLSEKQECLDLDQRFQSLSARERDVLRLVAKGLLNKQIAAELDIAEVTVKVHRARVMKKMQANSLAELSGMTVKMKLPPCSAPIR